jgi:hypothetical protein
MQFLEIGLRGSIVYSQLGKGDFNFATKKLHTKSWLV